MQSSYRTIRDVLRQSTYAEPRFMSCVFFSAVRSAGHQKFYTKVRNELGPDVFDAVADYRGNRTQEAVAANFLQSRKKDLRRWWEFKQWL